jgi:hypothetical protein
MPKKLALYLLIALLLFSSFDKTVSSRANDDADAFASLVNEAAHLKFNSAEWQALQAKQIVARTVSRTQEKEMASFGAMIAEASPAEFFTAFQTLSVFAKSETTIACGRFSAKPTIADLDALPLSDKDLYALMHAKLNAADIKLSATDITRLQKAAGPQPLFSPKVKARLATEYKQLLLEKTQAYLENGDSALESYTDQELAVSPQQAFAEMLKAQSASGVTTQLYSRLAGHPRETESFVYWALQKFGKLKPVISLVHVVIHCEGQRAFIASKQIYSSHYTEAGLGIAELISFASPTGQPRTLMAYTIRLQVDLLDGSMSFMKKRMAQPHMLENLKTSLTALRLNVETLRQSNSAQGL